MIKTEMGNHKTLAYISLAGMLFLMAYLIFVSDACAQYEEKEKVELKVGFEQTPIPFDEIKSLGGFFGERVSKNKDNYLKTFPIEDYVAFIEQRTHKDWDWKKAEQPGKWIESSIFTCSRTGDQELKEKVKVMLQRVLDSQEEEGYVGATSPEVRTPEKPLRGMDPYELYFLEHAFMTAYEEWNDPQGLEGAKKLADYFVKYIGPGKAEFWPNKERYPENKGMVYRGTKHSDLAGHSLHYSWEGTLFIDPMLRLYELTGDKRYFDWCVWVIDNIDKWSGWDAYSNLDKVADGTMKVNEIQPYVHSHTFQMNFLGFLRMYQITGDSSFLRKVRGVWDDVASRQMYITGGVSVGEHYERDYIKPLTGEMVETCASMSWLQMSQYLLELTGDTKYADAMERLIWNHVFAAQTIDGDGNRYDTPPNGVKPKGYYHGPDCCTASGHKLMSLLPSFIYSKGTGEDIYINQFVESTASIVLPQTGEVKVSQMSKFPETENITIEVNPVRKSKFTMHIRIPGWCQNPQVIINKKVMSSVTSGTYLSIYRKWKPGDKVELRFPMELRWERREHHMKVSDRKPYKAEEDNNPPYALLRGPIVYSLDNIWYEGEENEFPENVMEDVKFVLSNPESFEKVETKGNYMLGPGYKVPVELADNHRIVMTMYPFANTGIWYKDKDHKPEKDSGTYSYAIWLKGVKDTKP